MWKLYTVVTRRIFDGKCKSTVVQRFSIENVRVWWCEGFSVENIRVWLREGLSVETVRVWLCEELSVI